MWPWLTVEIGTLWQLYYRLCFSLVALHFSSTWAHLQSQVGISFENFPWKLSDSQHRKRGPVIIHFHPKWNEKECKVNDTVLNMVWFWKILSREIYLKNSNVASERKRKRQDALTRCFKTTCHSGGGSQAWLKSVQAEGTSFRDVMMKTMYISSLCCKLQQEN